MGVIIGRRLTWVRFGNGDCSKVGLALVIEDGELRVIDQEPGVVDILVGESWSGCTHFDRSNEIIEYNSIISND